jgi:hypothetical protein
MADQATLDPFRRSEAAETARRSGLSSDGRIGKAAITQSRVIAFRVEHADRVRALTVRLRLKGIAGNLDGGGLRRRGAVRHQERHGHDCKDLLHSICQHGLMHRTITAFEGPKFTRRLYGWRMPAQVRGPSGEPVAESPEQTSAFQSRHWNHHPAQTLLKVGVNPRLVGRSGGESPHRRLTWISISPRFSSSSLSFFL